jgi:hypothetical protein
MARRGQPPGLAEDQCRWAVCHEDRFPWPTVAGRFRACELGSDGNLYVALEDQGKIIRVKPE